MSEEPKVMSAEINDYLCRIHEAISEARKSSYNIFAVFLEAYENLSTKDFITFRKKIDYEKTSINKMKKICNNPTVLRYIGLGKLPESWGTLHQIALLNESDIDNFITNGSLNKNSTFKDVMKLRKPHKTPKTKSKDDSVSVSSSKLVLELKSSANIDNIAKTEIQNAMEVLNKYFTADGELYNRIFEIVGSNHE
ncbi:hypothetical protein ACMC5R_05625 [Deferribacteres bacterium DY0037]